MQRARVRKRKEVRFTAKSSTMPEGEGAAETTVGFVPPIQKASRQQPAMKGGRQEAL
jgi:hypothetical protein